jgi:8-oxo-dGTP diphosphatase
MKILISSSAIIYNDKNQVLLAKRSENKKLDAGLWETFGGSLKFGESPKECLEREISEELCCKLKNIELLDVYSYVNNTLEMQLISIQYIAQIDGFPIFNAKEIADLKWFTKQEVKKLKFSVNCKERILDYFRRVRSKET